MIAQEICTKQQKVPIRFANTAKMVSSTVQNIAMMEILMIQIHVSLIAQLVFVILKPNTEVHPAAEMV